MRVWLWLVYKFTKNCQIYWLFSEFIQTKKRYPTSLDKIHIQNTYQNTYQLGNYLSYQAKIFLMNLTPKELTCCKISNICHCAFKPRSHDIFFSWTFDLRFINSNRYLLFGVFFLPHHRLFRERQAFAQTPAHAHLEMSRWAKNWLPNKQQISRLDCFYFLQA